MARKRVVVLSGDESEGFYFIVRGANGSLVKSTESRRYAHRRTARAAIKRLHPGLDIVFEA